MDMAYVVSILPLFIMLKIPMISFLILIIIFIIFKKSPAKRIFTLFILMLGAVALFLSLYGAFSFTGLSRLKLFLELLVYLLLIVVSMQRLTHEINFYLIISPFLFLALSLFFYQGMFMLVYVIFEIFFLLWIILTYSMNGKLIESFRTSMLMFAYSLPWVIILFIFFPRISFEHADYGFKGEHIQRMGHDGTMFLDGNALLVPSSRIVMEVGFDEAIPPSDALYFRGSMLYIDKKDHWEGIATHHKRPLPSLSTGKVSTSYQITLYPTQKKWLYLLDMPYQETEETTLDTDLISTVSNVIDEPIHYRAYSSLSNRYVQKLDTITHKFSTDFDPHRNPQSYRLAQKMKKQYPSLILRAKALENLFKSQGLTYTLKPDALDIEKSTDSFLFDKKKGYCVHFASSYVNMARMLDIPSRIVTGYKSNAVDSMKNYLAIREKDAHAWAELYINGAWIRVETTATASFIDEISQASLNQKSHPMIEKINLYLMYVKYQVETWILYYSHIRQLELLAYAKDNPSFVVGFVISIVSIIIASLMLVIYFRRPRYRSKALEAIQPLLKALKKKGYERQEEQSMHQFLLSIKGIETVDTLYQEICYGGKLDKETLKKLKRKVKEGVKILG
jgi:hypothetical protein